MQDLWIILLAAVPVMEIRGALPIALQSYQFSIPRALIDCYLGNALPVPFLVFGLRSLVRFSEQHVPVLHRWLLRFFERTHRKFAGSYQTYGALALFIFVAIPLPLTGVWTASAAAVLFGIRPRLAIPAIIGGMMVAGLVVLMITKGIVTGLDFLAL